MADDRPNPPQSESVALAVFCTVLPELRVRAERGFWTDILDMHVAEVSGGGSALAACRELGLEFKQSKVYQRGADQGIDGARTDWLPPPSLTGDYHCPLRRCSRRAERDDRGRPPRCPLADQQMSFVRQDSG